MKLNLFSRPLVRILAGLAGSAILALVVVALWPARRTVYVLQTSPPPDYETARERVRQIEAEMPADVRRECRSVALDHGHRTRDAYVLLHGLTNCPAQFREFAAELYAGGANVIVPRLPEHGLADRLTRASANLTAQGMLDSANLAIDLAHGYGERVIVVGLSVSGVTAAWLAQMRTDVDLVVGIAPFFAPAGLPDAGIRPLANVLLRAPNIFVWWDPRAREALAGSPFSYPRFPTHALGQVIRLGLDVFDRAAANPPRAPRILLVVAADDPAISVPRVRELAGLWRTRAALRIFPAEWKVPHDCIDPDQPGAVTARVYPQLRAWIDEALAP